MSKNIDHNESLKCVESSITNNIVENVKDNKIGSASVNTPITPGYHKIVKKILIDDFNSESLINSFSTFENRINEYLSVKDDSILGNIVRKINSKGNENLVEKKFVELFNFADSMLEVYPDEVQEIALKEIQRILLQLNKKNVEVSEESIQKHKKNVEVSEVSIQKHKKIGESQLILKNATSELRNNIRLCLDAVFSQRKIHKIFTDKGIYHFLGQMESDSTAFLMGLATEKDKLSESSILRAILFLRNYAYETFENNEVYYNLTLLRILIGKLEKSPIKRQLIGYNKELKSLLNILALITFIKKKDTIDLTFILKGLKEDDVIRLASKEFKTPITEISQNSIRTILEVYHRVFRLIRIEIIKNIPTLLKFKACSISEYIQEYLDFINLKK